MMFKNLLLMFIVHYCSNQAKPQMIKVTNSKTINDKSIKYEIVDLEY